MSQALDPSAIFQLAVGYWPSKVLLSAVKLGVFTVLSDGPLTGEELQSRLGLHPRATYDFLDALVALRMLDRSGTGKDARYANTPETDHYLDRAKPGYIGGIFEMHNDRLFRFWADLDTALKTGQPQNEVQARRQPDVRGALQRSGTGLNSSCWRCGGPPPAISLHFADRFDFSGYKTLCDVGGATGILSCLVARRHPHLRCQSFDLPVVEPIARAHIERDGLSERVEAVSGDFFKDGLPKADVITMGMILHDWNLDGKMKLIRAAYDALPEGGAFVAVENLIDDERRENVFGLMMSLNMLIEFGDAFDFTFADFKGWCEAVGFKRFDTMPLAGPGRAAIAYK